MCRRTDLRCEQDRSDRHRLEERLAHWTKPKLLIVADLGCLPLETEAAHTCSSSSSRVERGSLLVTSNRAATAAARS